MNDLRTAAQQALEFCEFLWRDVPLNDYSEDLRQDVEAALRAALAEPVQEPRLRYDGLYEYAAQHKLDYNKLCCIARAALAEPVQEPVAWLSPASQSMIGRDDGEGSAYHIITTSKATGNHTIPLYTAPPQRKPLTEEEMQKVAAPYYGTMGFRVEAFARAIERAHGIGEQQ